MKNYLVITYDEKDNNCNNPIEIKRLHYSEPKDVINFIYNLNPKTKYEIYKEIFIEITEEEAIMQEVALSLMEHNEKVDKCDCALKPIVECSSSKTKIARVLMDCGYTSIQVNKIFDYIQYMEYNKE